MCIENQYVKEHAGLVVRRVLMPVACHEKPGHECLKTVVGRRASRLKDGSGKWVSTPKDGGKKEGINA